MADARTDAPTDLKSAAPAPAEALRGRVWPLSPTVVFPALWVIGVLAAQIKVSDTQGPWPGLMWAVVVITPAAFVLGGAWGAEAVRRRIPARRAGSLQPTANRRLRMLLAACVVVGWAELIHQYIAAGSIPLLDESISRARLEQPGGPSILLANTLTAAAVVALAVPKRLLSRNALPELAIAAICVTGFVLQGGRTTVVLVLVAAFFVRWLHWGRPSARVLVWGGVLLLVAVSAFFYIRADQNRALPFERELYGEILPSTPAVLEPFIPLHLGFATNFEALAGVVERFPGQEPFGYGAFSAHGIDAFVPSARDLSDVSARISPPWITSTVAGTLWADGGMLVLVPGIALIGALASAAFEWQRRTRRFHSRLVAGYLLYLAAFGFYTNLWTQHVDWIVVCALLLFLGVAAERPGRLRDLKELWPRYAPAVAKPEGPRPSTAPRRRMRGGAPLRRVGAAVEALSPRRRIGLLAVGLAVALGAGVLLENLLDTDADERVNELKVTERLEFPVGSTPRRNTEVVTDGDVPDDNASLWALTRGTRAVSAREFAFARASLAQPRPRKRVSLGRPSAGAAIDIARWDRGIGPSLFAAFPSATGIGVAVYDLEPRVLPRAQGFARIAKPREKGARRDLRIATLSGTRPDLFVIDRGLPRERVAVTVFSGESRFARRILEAKAPIRGAPPGLWTLDVGRTTAGEKPDLLLVTRAGATQRVEAHLVSGRTNYQSFALQSATELRAFPPRGTGFALGSVLGRPAMYVTGRGPTVPVISLAAD